MQEQKKTFKKSKSKKKRKPLGGGVRNSLKRYFRDLNGEEPQDMYKTVMNEVERELIDFVMGYTARNQSHTARILGISRSTLRAKLERMESRK